MGDIANTNQQIGLMNIPEQPSQQEQDFKRKQFGNMLLSFSDVLKGRNPAPGAMQRTAMLDAQRKEAERKRQQNEFVKNNPQYRNAIKLNTLFPGLKLPTAKDRKIILQNGIQYYADTGEPVLPNAPSPKPPKTTKSDFVVDILQNIKNHVPTEDEPTYELSKSEQNILDTISATDPLEIYKRSIYNQIGLSDPFSDIPTIINEEDYEKLNNGDKFIFNGIEYTKGE
jgi:hypothetical protein